MMQRRLSCFFCHPCSSSSLRFCTNYRPLRQYYLIRFNQFDRVIVARKHGIKLHNCSKKFVIMMMVLSNVLAISLLSILFVVKEVATFTNVGMTRGTLLRLWVANSLSPAASFDEDDTKKTSGFDVDFAEAMSKPLPAWFKEQKQQKEDLLKEEQLNRERILREFQAKYDIPEQEKQAQMKARWAKWDEDRKNVPWYKKALGLGGPPAISEEEMTAKEAWEDNKKFWQEEYKDTGFYLPGFFEVFPELKLKWPKWSKNRQGKITKCKVNDDCPFPESCCPHPILPGDKFCCTGFGKRMLVPAPQPLYVKSQYNELGPYGGKDRGSGKDDSGQKLWGAFSIN